MKIRLHDLPIYIPHYTRLADRRERLEQDLARRGLFATWLTANDRDDLTQELIDGHCQYDELVWRQKTEFYTRLPARRLRPAEISLALKHLESYRRVVSEHADCALVLEDDAILAPNFAEAFDRFFSNAPDD